MISRGYWSIEVDHRLAREVDVGLVDEHRRAGLEQLQQRTRREEVAGRIVRRGQNYQPGALRGFQQRLQLDVELSPTRDLQQRNFVDIGEEAVHPECRRGSDHGLAGLHDGAHHQVQQLVSARAGDDLLGRDGEMLRESAPQFNLLRVGIDREQVSPADRLHQRGADGRMSAERVLIGVKLERLLDRDADSSAAFGQRHDRVVAGQLGEVRTYRRWAAGHPRAR